MGEVAMIGLGGFLGSIFRYWLGGDRGACQGSVRVPLGDPGGQRRGVLRGIEGFGAHSRLHTAKILRLSEDLPIVVEIVDTREKIDKFLPTVDEAVTEGLASLE